MKTYNPALELRGEWEVSLKLDGVNIRVAADGTPYTRGGKIARNIPHNLRAGEYECYLGAWETTMSAISSHAPVVITQDDMYALDVFGQTDARLIMDTVTNPSLDDLHGLMVQAIRQGCEGIVIRNVQDHGTTYKIKPTESFDVEILSLNGGKGALEGTLGSITTKHGNVGVGLSREIRDMLWQLGDGAIGMIIEVEALSITSNNKFREPRFVRIRWDRMNEVANGLS